MWVRCNLSLDFVKSKFVSKFMIQKYRTWRILVVLYDMFMDNIITRMDIIVIIDIVSSVYCSTWITNFTSVITEKYWCNLELATFKLFLRVFREGKISNVWKSAYIFPLPKVTPALEVHKDLGPISLTPLLSKGLEPHVVKWLWEIILTKLTLNILDQWGTLLLFTHWWSIYIIVTTLQRHLEILFGSFC